MTFTTSGKRRRARKPRSLGISSSQWEQGWDLKSLILIVGSWTTCIGRFSYDRTIILMLKIMRQSFSIAALTWEWHLYTSSVYIQSVGQEHLNRIPPPSNCCNR